MIFNIQRFSTHDGPGIRTVVFLKGCPLRCPWCENPEGQSPRPELFYDSRLCVGCLECLSASRRGEVTVEDGFGGRHPAAGGAARLVRPVFHRERITSAERFRQVCPAAALTVTGEERSVEGIADEAEKDRVFYGNTGGVTLSGGEPFAQPRFLLALVRELHRRAIDAVIETSLQAPWRAIEPVLPYLSLILADLKHVDPIKYHDATGGELSEVLANFGRLRAEGARVLVRVPVIPGFNDQDLAAIIHRAASLATVRELHLLPYHKLGQGKLKLLGRDDPMATFGATGEAPALSEEGLAPFVGIAESEGLKAVIGG